MKTRLFSTILLLVMSAAGVFGDVLRVGSGSPYSSITSALAAASPGDEIWVSAGTYREAELIIPSGVSVYGGFTGSETQLSERNFAQNVTILDGSGSHRVATVSGRLDGFTLRNGRTGDNGGGAYIKGGGTLANCIAFANEAGYDGGAVFAEDGGTVKNSLLTGNRAGNNGAAISGLGAYSAAHVTATGNEFTNAPEIKKVLETPAPIVAGQQLNVAEPDITKLDEVDPRGSTVLLKGWELDGHAIPMPYTVTYADNGKKLRFWAANAVGVGMSNEVTVTVIWTVTSAVQLITPKAVCEGLTLADAGITEPSFSPAPADVVTYEWSIDGTPISGLDYVLQYSDNGKLLTCKVKSGDIVGAKTPAVRLAVMKAPEILLPAVTALSIEEGQQLCLPSPYVASNGSDLTSQGWHYGPDSDNLTAFTSCDKAIKAMDGKHLYYTASNGCGDAVTLDYATLTVTNAVGEFLQQEPVICDGMTLGDAIGFADGDNVGEYYIGTEELTGTSWNDVKNKALSTADNLKVLKFVYNGGKGERRLTLQVHAVPSLTKDLVQTDHNDAVCMGDSYTLEAGVDGESLGYRWQTATGNDAPATDADWSDVTGGSSSALRFSVGGDAWYRCLATGVCIDRTGNQKTTIGDKTYLVSTAVKVSHTTKPVIPEDFDLSGNTALLNVCEGTLFSAVFKEDNKPTVQKAGEGDAPGTTSEGWMLGGVKVTAGQTITAADNGKALGYWAMNRCGESTATFNTLTLKVSGKVSILQSPADQTVNEGGRVRLSVLTAAPAECTYLWQLLAADGVTWSAAPAGTDGNDKAVYTFVTPSGDDVPADRRNADSYTDQYRCVITSSNACGAADVQTSDAATVTVLRSSTEVAITAQPTDGEVCAGDTHELKVTAKNRTALSFQWYRDGRKVTATDGDIVAPAGNNATGTTSIFKAKVSGTYYCLVTSVDNPTGTRSDEATVIVHPIPAVITNIADATICKGSTTTLKYVVSGDDVTYQWTKQSAPGTSLGSGSSLDVTPDATTTYVVEVTAKCSDKAAAGLFRKEATVTVNDKPSITGGPSDVIRLCEGTEIGTPTAVTVDFKGSAGISQSWTLNGIDIKPADYTVSTADQGKVLAYRAKNGCGETINDFAGKVTLNIDKRPQLLQSPSDVTVEEGTQVRLSVLTGDKNVTYKWVSTADETTGLSSTSAYSYTPKELTGSELTGGKRTEQYYCIITAPTGSTCKGDNNDLDGADKDKPAFEKSSIATVEVQRKTTSITITAQPVEAYPEACAINDAGAINKTVFASGISITAEGRGALTFTWYKNGKAVTAGDGTVENGSEITLPAGGGDRDPLTPTVQQTSTFHPTGAGTYFCQVSSSDNASGVRSEQAVLTVHPPVKFTNDLGGITETLCEDSNLSLSVVATGDNRSYQWQWKAKDAGDATYAAIAGETDSRLRTAVDGNKTYRCVLTASCADGTNTAATTKLSQTHTVTMSQKPEVTLDAGVAPILRVCAGSTVTLPADSKLTIDLHNGDLVEKYWTLGGQKFDAGAYTAKAADNGKSFGYYVQNGCGTTSAVFGLALEVHDLPVILQQPQSVEVEMGSQVRLGVRASVNHGTLSYNWQMSQAGGNWTNVIPACTDDTYTFTAEAIEDVAVASVTTSYRCLVTLSGSSCAYNVQSSGEAVVKVNRTRSSVSIVSQPAGYEFCSSDAFSALEIEVKGSGNFTYKWYKQGTAAPVREESKAKGTQDYTKDSFTPANTPAQGAGTYYCVVESSDGTSIRSQQAVVTMYREPDGVDLVKASGRNDYKYTVCSDKTLMLAVTTTGGDDLTYQWYKNSSTSTSGGSACAGATGQTYTPLDLAAGDNYYYCEVKSRRCSDKAGQKSNAAIVTMYEAPVINDQPASQTVCEGTSATLTINADHAKAGGYTWYLNGAAQAGKTTNTLSASTAGVYTCKVESEYCGSVMSAPALLTVAAVPVVSLGDASSLKACKGDLVTLPSPTVDARGSLVETAKTGWFATDDVNEKLVSSYLVTGKKVYKYKLTYRCSEGGEEKPWSSNPVLTFTVDMTEEAQFTDGALKPALSKNAGEQVAENELTSAGISVTGGSKEWLLGGTPVTLPYTVSAADNGKSFEVRARNACGGEVYLTNGGDHAKTALTVNSLSITTQPQSQAYCEGDAAAHELSIVTNIKDGVTRQWYQDGKKIAAATGATYTLGKTTAAAGVYTCEVKLGTLTVVSSPAVVTVKRKPTLLNGTSETITVCKGMPLTLQTEAVGDGLHYAWKKGNAPTGGDASSLTIGAAEAATYTCTVSGECPATPAVVRTFTVNVTSPVAITAQPVGQTVCEGTNFVGLRLTATNATGYQWYKDGGKLGTGNNQAASGAGAYYCVVSNGCGSVSSATVVLSQVKKPSVSLPTATITACAGDVITLPAPSVEANGSVVNPSASGWFNTTATNALVSSYKVTGAATFKYRVSYTCAGGAATAVESGALSVAVPAAPSISGALNATVTKNAGESVSLTDLQKTTLSSGVAWTLNNTLVSLPYKVSAADDGKTFRCVTVNACGVESNALTSALTVKSLSITTQPVSQTYCEGVTGKKLMVAANISAGINYKWYKDGVATAITAEEYPLSGTLADAGVYTCEVKLGTLMVVSSPAVVTVNAKPAVVATTENLTVCSGSPLTLQCEATGAGLTYSWKKDGGAELGKSSSLTVAAPASGKYICTVTGTCNTPVTKTVTVTVHTPIAITTQPKSLTSCTLADLTVAATGTGSETAANYTWYKDGAATAVKAKTYPVATLNADAADGKPHTYTCLVKGTCNEVMSAPAVVEKAIALSVGNITADRTTVCPGESVTLTLSATGDGIVYAWTGDKTGTTVLGTSSTLSVNPTANTTYTCKVTGTCNTTGVTKQQTITVTTVPTITGVLKAVEKKEGETVAQTDIQTTAPASAGNTLTWTLNDTPVKFGYTVSAADNGKVFKVTATNACGLSVTLGSTSTLSVRTAPRILEQPRGVTLCEGSGTVTLTVKASGSGLNYLWMKDGVNVANAAGAGGNDAVAGATDATLTLTKPAAARSGVYTCRVSGSGGDAVVSAPAVVTVNAKVSVTSAPQNVAICSGNSATLQIEATGALSYAWTKDANATVIGNASSLTVSGAGTYKCVVTGCGSSTITKTATVTVNTAPSLTAQPKSQTICEGSNFAALTVSATGSPIPTYQWYANGGKSSTGTSLTPAAEGTYYCVVSNACGSVASSTATLVKVKKPAISLAANNQSACVGEVITLPEVSVEANGSVIVTGSTGWYDGGTRVHSWQVSGTSAKTFTYKVGYQCAGGSTQTDVTTTVQVTPVVRAKFTAGLNLPQSYCEGSTITLTKPASEGGGAVTTTWYLNNTVQSSNITANRANHDGKTLRCVISNQCGSDAVEARLNVAKAPVVSFTAATVTYCPGSEVTLPTPSIEANGSVLDPAVSGWATTATGTPLAATVKAPAAGSSQDYYYRIQYTCGANAAAYATSATKMTVKGTGTPTTPTFTAPAASSLCDGDKVALPAITNKAVNGRWELNNRSLGNITEYRVHASDNGQVFKYVNIDACGQETPSGVSFSLNVKQPVRITGTLATPVNRKDGAQLSVAEPATTGTGTKTWKLNNGTPVTSGTKVTLANDKSLLTFRIDNGCTTAAPGSSAETSALLRVWKEPTFTGDGTETILAAQVGKPYTFPAPPVVAMNNCEVVSQGWIAMPAAPDADNYLDPLTLATLGDNAEIAYRVKYLAPDGTTGYADSKVMGKQWPWDVPTMTGAVGTIYAEVKDGAKWTLPPVSVRYNNTISMNTTWVYGAAYKGFDDPLTVDFNKHFHQPLYCKVVYTIPGNRTEQIVYLPAGILYPWRAPEFDAYSAQKWDKLCDTKTFDENGRTLPAIPYQLNQCTKISLRWKIGDQTVDANSKPTLAEEGKKVEYELTYEDPAGNQHTVSVPVALMEVYTEPKIYLNPPASGSELVGVIGSNIATALGVTTSEDKYGDLVLKNNLNRDVIVRGDDGTQVTYSASNSCGIASADCGVIKIKGNPAKHYSGLKHSFETDDNVYKMVYYDDHVFAVRSDITVPVAKIALEGQTADENDYREMTKMIKDLLTEEYCVISLGEFAQIYQAKAFHGRTNGALQTISCKYTDQLKSLDQSGKSGFMFFQIAL